MSRTSPQLRNFAMRLITLEANDAKPSTGSTAAVFPVPEKLRPQLTTLMGNAGFRVLLSRALALAKMEIPWLRAIQVNDEGVLQGWEELHTQLGPDKFLEGRVILIAQLLGLLVAFIGEKLTVRLVREVWPKLSLNDLNLKEGEKNEKTNKAG